MAKSSTDLETRVRDLEAKAKSIDKWTAVFGVLSVVFGITLAKTWDSVRRASEQADAAQLRAADAVEKLRSNGDTILASYRPKFDKWVEKAQSSLGVPVGVAVALTGKGPVPQGWHVCDAQSDFDTVVLVGTKDAAAVGPVEQGLNPVPRDQIMLLTGKSVSNIPIGYYRIRYVCR